jgi:hypothetical protein
MASFSGRTREMGLYLVVFDGDEEIAGVEVGTYSDFGAFRDYIVDELEGGRFASRFPTLMDHSDCDGEWSLADCKLLQRELSILKNELESKPPAAFSSEWQTKVARSIGLQPRSALHSFIDVDGEPLVERMLYLDSVALKRELPIVFQ